MKFLFVLLAVCCTIMANPMDFSGAPSRGFTGQPPAGFSGPPGGFGGFSGRPEGGRGGFSGAPNGFSGGPRGEGEGAMRQRRTTPSA